MRKRELESEKEKVMRVREWAQIHIEQNDRSQPRKTMMRIIYARQTEDTTQRETNKKKGGGITQEHSREIRNAKGHGHRVPFQTE